MEAGCGAQAALFLVRLTEIALLAVVSARALNDEISRRMPRLENPEAVSARPCDETLEPAGNSAEGTGCHKT